MSDPTRCVGELYVANRELLAEYQKLLAVTSKIASGEIDGRRFSANLAASTWQLAEEKTDGNGDPPGTRNEGPQPPGT